MKTLPRWGTILSVGLILKSIIGWRSSGHNFNIYFGKELVIYYLAGSGLTPAFGYDKEAGKRTKEIVGQYLEAYFQGFGVQRVKLPKEFNSDAISDLSKIELVEPEACEVNGRIFVKASGIKAVK